MATVVNVNDLLDGHVSLDLECLDRIYLNAYVPNLQVAGQVVDFMRDHLNKPIPSPSIMEKMGNRFRQAVVTFAEDHDIPVVHFKKGDRHIGLMRPYLEAATQARGGGHRGSSRVPVGLRGLPARHADRSPVLHLLHGRPTGDLLLLLRERR
jgi:hypothetical protein